MSQPEASPPAPRPIIPVWNEFKDFCWMLAGDPVLMPFANGEPDWPGTSRETVIKINSWADLEEADIPRLAILTDGFQRFIGRGEDVSVITLWREGSPIVQQIAGEPCARAVDAIMESIADDIPIDEACTAPVHLDLPEPPPSPIQEKLAALSERFDAARAARDTKALPVAANDNLKHGKFTITRFRDLGKAKPKPPVVKGVRYAGEFSYTVAKPGGGKSVIETDISYHVASGREWHGRKVEPGLVVYFAAERKPLQDRRVMALRKHFGDEGRDVPIVIIGGKPDLTHPARVDALKMVEIVKLLEGEYGVPCRHITIDTLARSFGGKNQNSTEDMSRFVFNVDLIMDKVPTAHVNVIHHEGWETGRAKGSIDLDGAVDASFRVTKDAAGYTLTCDGANDGDEGDILRFTMKSIDLGHDDDGEPVTAPVVVRQANVQQFAQAAVAKADGKAADMVLRVLHELAEGGHQVGGGMWLAKYRETDPAAKEDTIKRRYYRARTQLLESGNVVPGDRDDTYLPVTVTSSDSHSDMENVTEIPPRPTVTSDSDIPPLGDVTDVTVTKGAEEDFDPARDLPFLSRGAS